MTIYTPTAANLRSRLLRARLGAYVAGVGATAALTAGALVVFLWLATFVAFNGLPLGGSSGDVGAAYLDSSASSTSVATAAALGRARSAVAKDPVRGARGATATAGSVAAGSAGSGGGAISGKSGGAADPGVTSPPGDVVPPPDAVPSLPSTSGSVTDAVQGVDDAAGTSLSGPSRGTTRLVDGAAGGALERTGGAVARPGLGTRAAGAVSRITDGALGG